MYSTKTLVTLALAGAMVTACGDDSKKTPSEPENAAELAAEFRGNWEAGKLVEGKDEPEAAGCVGEKHPQTMDFVISSYDTVRKTTQYVNAISCQGDNFIVEVAVRAYKQVSRSDNEQVIQPFAQSYGYVIRGDETAKVLNEERVCGHSNWQAKDYKWQDAEIQACTVFNTKGFIFTDPDVFEFGKKVQYRLRLKGEGESMEMSQRKTTEANSKFGTPFYFVRF